MDRPLPEHHVQLLKSALKLDEEATLPEHVEEIYWCVERTARRIGQNIDGNTLVMICMLANRPTTPDPVSFLDAKPAYGDKVLAKFRGDWRWGVFHKMARKKVVVQLDDDTAEEREFHPTQVRRPSREEKALIGE
jgi:hypothetical protein